MNSATLFETPDPPASSVHRLYKWLDAQPGWKTEVEDMWGRCSSLLDRDFRAKFRRETSQRLNELYFADWFYSQANLTPRTPKDAGKAAAPDWELTLQDDPSYRFHVEATCPGEASEDNRVPPSNVGERNEDGSNAATQDTDYGHIEKAILRLSSRLCDKAKSKQAARAVNEGIPFVLAMSAIGLPEVDYAPIDGACPVPHSSLLLRFVFGLDSSLDWRSSSADWNGPDGDWIAVPKDSFQKSTTEINAGVFLQDEEQDNEQHYSSISAVLFTGWSPLRWEGQVSLSGNVQRPPAACVVHNWNAQYPLQRGIFRDCVEYCPEPDGDNWRVRIQRPTPQ